MIRAASFALLVLVAAPGAGAEQRRVAFTFDDIPGIFSGGCPALAEQNRKIVTAIRRNRIPALGLVNAPARCGTASLTENYAIWLDGGIELGNHTRFHRDFNRTPLEEYQADILAVEEVLAPLVEKRKGKLRYFRYPYLRSGTELPKKRAFEKFLRDEGYTNAPVTIDSDEYLYAAAYRRAIDKGDRALAKRVTDDYIRYMESVFVFYEKLSRDTLGYELPQILLLHDNLLNAKHLDRLVAMARGRGYKIVSTEEALRDPAYARQDAYTGSRGLSWLHRWALDAGKPAPEQPAAASWLVTRD